MEQKSKTLIIRFSNGNRSKATIINYGKDYEVILTGNLVEDPKNKFNLNSKLNKFILPSATFRAATEETVKEKMRDYIVKNSSLEFEIIENNEFNEY